MYKHFKTYLDISKFQFQTLFDIFKVFAFNRQVLVNTGLKEFSTFTEYIRQTLIHFLDLIENGLCVCVQLVGIAVNLIIKQTFYNSFIILMAGVYLLNTIFESMPSASNLIVNPGYFAFQYITMCFPAIITTFLVTVGTRIDVGLL